MAKSDPDVTYCAYCGEPKTNPSPYCSQVCEYAEAGMVHRDAIRPPAPINFDFMMDTRADTKNAQVLAGHHNYVLPTDSEERKQIPLFSGVLNYFPLALAAVARVSHSGNDKHNPGQPIHWARGKSMDHSDCIARHLLDIESVNSQGEYEDAMALAWRALAKLQELEEKRLGKPMSRGSRLEPQ
jgi:hypothetical protein